MTDIVYVHLINDDEDQAIVRVDASRVETLDDAIDLAEQWLAEQTTDDTWVMNEYGSSRSVLPQGAPYVGGVLG